MTNDQQAELERLAFEATPGPWKACATIYEHMNCELRGGAKGEGQGIAQVWEAPNAFKDGQFIAAANPAAVLELIAAARRGWQPIETAPRDGTLVMVGAPGCGVSLVRWMLDTWLDEQGFTQGSWPTHWMPLPAAPDASGNDKVAGDEAAQQRSETLIPPPNAGEGLHIRAFHDGLRIFDGDTRMEGPWSYGDREGAFRALKDRIQALRSNSPEAG